jgi:hypothetical protein
MGRPKVGSFFVPKLKTPTSNRFIGKGSASVEHLLKAFEAERKSEIQPDAGGDDLGWEAMSFIKTSEVTFNHKPRT